MTLRTRVRQLSAQSVIYGLSGAFTKLAGLILVPVLGHIFAPRDYAVIDLITAFTSALGAVILLGSDAAVAYYFYRETDEVGRKSLVSTWLTFQFVLNTTVGAILFIFAQPLTHLILGSTHSDIYLKLTGCAFPLGSTFNYTLEVLRLQMRPRRYLLISGINIFSGLLLTLSLVWALHLGLVGVYISTLITNTISCAVALRVLGNAAWPHLSVSHLRRILGYGIPLVPISLSAWAIALSNRLFIKVHSGAADVALFAVGNRIAQLLALIVSAFALAWGPFALSIAESAEAKRVYSKVLTFYAAGLSWLVLALSLFAPLILAVALKPAYARGYQVVAPLSLSYAVAGAYPIVAIGAALSRKTIHLSWTTITAALTTVALNAVLVPLPRLPLIGGALATLGGNLLWVILVYFVSQRVYPIPYERRKVLICLSMLTLIIIGGQFLHGAFSSLTVTGIGVRLLLLTIFPVLIVMTGVIERYEVAVLVGYVARLWHKWQSKAV